MSTNFPKGGPVFLNGDQFSKVRTNFSKRGQIFQRKDQDKFSKRITITKTRTNAQRRTQSFYIMIKWFCIMKISFHCKLDKIALRLQHRSNQTVIYTHNSWSQSWLTSYSIPFNSANAGFTTISKISVPYTMLGWAVTIISTEGCPRAKTGLDWSCFKTC